MFLKIVALVVFGVIFGVCDGFLFTEPCNRTITTGEIDFIIGKGCTRGVISIKPSASGSLSAYVMNNAPGNCSTTVCVRSCNTVTSAVFALVRDPFQCCHTFPRPSIDFKDSTDAKNETLYRYSTFGEDWLCTLPHPNHHTVVDMTVQTSGCSVPVDYQFTEGEDYMHSPARFVFNLKVEQDGKLRDLFKHLEEHNLTMLYRITPSTYIFEYRGSQRKSELQEISRIKSLYRHNIIATERVKVYRDTLKPEARATNMIWKTLRTNELHSYNLICEKYYGMGVPKAWSGGYTGEGVVIGVTDVGINTDLLDLKNNINNNLSYNFVDDSGNVTPNYFHNIQDMAPQYTGHGNNVASIIAATKGNDLCSSGISYNATIVAIKIYKVVLDYGMLYLEPGHWTRSDIIARALVYGLHEIDIFANAWAPTKAFDALDLATREALKYGAENGRRGLGTIYVVPAGPPGNELSNNIHTVSVNSIGRYGSLMRGAVVDASVLTSGLGHGNNLTALNMVTTSFGNRCISSFKGVSAATAQISAIIGLALHANAKLSLRDVQHLLVDASDHTGLEETIAFTRNGANRPFHGVFGFGLLNADKLTSLAVSRTPAPALLSRTLTALEIRTSGTRTHIFQFCHSCDKYSSSDCLTTVEHVKINMRMRIKASSNYIRMELTSPSGTPSVIMDIKQPDKSPIVPNLQLVSVHFWDEVPFGKWILVVQHDKSSDTTEMDQISLTIYGTRNETVAHIAQTHWDTCGNVTEEEHTDTVHSLSKTTDFPTSHGLLLALVYLNSFSVLVL